MRRPALSMTKIVLGLALAVLSLSALADQVLDRAGNPDFDYLLGIAALDSGHGERAVFALERVLAVQPSNALARAEIARAYLFIGEKDTARREFENVKREPIRQCQA